MEHNNRRDFDDADALEPAPGTDTDDHTDKSVHQHDWGRGEALEPGGDREDGTQSPPTDEPQHDRA